MAVISYKLLVCLLTLSGSTLARAECFNNVDFLKGNNIKARWLETTENDGKPLIISITNGSNGLVYTARKSGAIWFNGNVTVCRSPGGTEITLKSSKATSSVPILAREGFPSTQSALIVNNQIKFGGGGWGGTFVGQ